jgi:hypothetical protein
MLTCSGTVIRDDPININSEETNQQLKMLLDSIIEFLTKAINYQTHVPDISTATVQAALQKTGFQHFVYVKVAKLLGPRSTQYPGID